MQEPVEIGSDDFVLGETEDLGLLDLLPPDPLLTTALHKIVFALELVIWDRPVEQAGSAKEIHHLRLEPWEVGSYQYLVSRHDERGTLAWELQVFLLSSAASAGQDGRGDFRAQSAQSGRQGRTASWSSRSGLPRASNERGRSTVVSGGSSTTCFSREPPSGWSRSTAPTIGSGTRSPGLWLEHHASGGVTPL